MTNENIRKLAVEISKSQQKKTTPVKGKGKCRIILPEESDDEDEKHASAMKSYKMLPKVRYQLKNNLKSSL